MKQYRRRCQPLTPTHTTELAPRCTPAVCDSVCPYACGALTSALVLLELGLG